jgi:UDP-glucose:glycoprotein glucosyltransferase
MLRLLFHPTIVLFYLVWSVEGWSSLFSTSNVDDDSNINAPTQSNPLKKRLLASFEKFSHVVPENHPVTPRGRRDIEVSLKAHSWPTTIFSPLCEAWSFIDESIGKIKSSSLATLADEEHVVSPAWRYLDAIVEIGGIPSLDGWVNDEKSDGGHDNSQQQRWTIENSTTLAIQIASHATTATTSDNTVTLDQNLLLMSLALRAHSPHCEMHRSLARDAAITLGLYDNSSRRSSLPAAFAIVSRVESNTVDNSTAVLGTRVIVDASLLPAAVEALKLIQMVENVKDESSSLLLALPGETFYPTTSQRDDDDSITVILYGHVGTTGFTSLYQLLKDLHIKFVVRHMGYIPYEEEMNIDGPSSRRATPTILQGYGVRLDIRNVEYKAFDDGSTDKTKDGDAELDWNDVGHDPTQPARKEYLAGVNLATLLGRFENIDDGPLASDMQALQTALIQSHPTQLRSESIVPPSWRRRSLSLQAAIVIANASDPLETLMGVSQNLPSVAHALSNIQVPESFEALSDEATSLATTVGAISPGWGDAAFGLFINSRLVDVERPSFNVFQLLGVLRKEASRLHDLEQNFKPILSDHVAMWTGNEKSKADAQWEALQAVRRIYDMGTEQLKKMGKRGMFGYSESEDDNVDEEQSSLSPKIRVDVGRGSRTAVLYLNDIEKDIEYRSWPRSVQEMLYRSQFGGAPTVRRNLFTMLIVIDPASRTIDNPALGVVGQLLRSSFPLRLGVLFVNDVDVARNSTSSPEPWKGGDRVFHARDSLLIYRHISKRFGAMASISCFIQVMYNVNEKQVTSAIEYVAIHLSFLIEMNVIEYGQSDREQSEMLALLRNSEESTLNEITYESAVQFAVDKAIRPGMSFLNGLPLPDGSNPALFESGINEILQYEQRHIMGLIMTGVITDTAPRSIYATVLKGDNLYKQYHPLLRDGAGEYMAIHSNRSSLILPKTGCLTEDLDAIFLVEGVFDLDSPAGVNLAVSFLDLIISSSATLWHESKVTSMVFRILPSTTPTSPQAQVLSSILCTSSRFELLDIRAIVNLVQGTTHKNVADIISFIEQSGVDDNVIGRMVAVAGKSECPPTKSTKNGHKNFFLINGRLYVPDDLSISTSDISILVSMEIDRTHAITKIVLPYLLAEVPEIDGQGCLMIHQTIGTVAALLGEKMSSSSSTRERLPHDIVATFDSQSSETNPLYFSWNEDSTSARHLQVKVSVILDPLTEPTQRVAPLLLAIRDVLKLPLRLMIAPRKVVKNDVPLSSYYRFVADPSLFSDSNPPNALFQNLPKNHVLTLRMDVPEMWDVQQAQAIQDSDNLRCDSRSGCGDQVGSEKATIEFGLKSLLFFGQCYDVSKNTPPNGLQLTLDRGRTGGNENSDSAAEFQPDGSISISNQMHSFDVNERTDTLVMKTVGYWQVRANPGVWDLRIDSNSRGAKIYHMVDGTVTSSGRVQLSDTSIPTYSKTLVMKDFTNKASFLLVNRNEGYEEASLFDDSVSIDANPGNETVHIFSLATGHAYERLLKIMMLSVTKRTSSPVKFWLFENVSDMCA